MLKSGRQVVRTLIRRGELVHVMLQGADGDERSFHALRGHTGLLDLRPLMGEGQDDVSVPAATRAEPPAATSVEDAGTDDGAGMQERLLHAMETAQSLQVSRGGGLGAGAWLEPVLEMLDGTLDDYSVYVELHPPHAPPQGARRLFTVDADERPFWATTRTRGEMIILSDLTELPQELKTLSGVEPTSDDAAVALAAPLFAPKLDDPGEIAGEREEVGVLYILCRRAMPRDQFTKLGVRLSRFVTHSWHQRLLMNRLVHTDQLTGVRNRGYFDSQFVLELERSKRQDSGLVLLLGDIDHFKHVNDTYGHPTGDRVLKTVARELLQGLRRIDIVCRVGGEEFALILPDTTMEAARDVVTRIQVRIANLRLTDPDHPDPIRTSISFGGVAYPEGGDDHETLYRLADRMLYLSKQRGRNRCHFWRADGDPLLTLPHYESS